MPELRYVFFFFRLITARVVASERRVSAIYVPEHGAWLARFTDVKSPFRSR